MNILHWLNRNNNSKNSKMNWEDTEEGKRFYDKALASAQKRAEEKLKWEKNVPLERRIQLQLFRIFFTFFFICFFCILYFGFKYNIELWILLGEGLFALLSFVFFIIKPKFIKYPNCFMMPVIAFGCTLFMYVLLGAKYGFNPNRNKDSVNSEQEILQDYDNDYPESEFLNDDYSKWLEINNFETKEELKNDYQKIKNRS